MQKKIISKFKNKLRQNDIVLEYPEMYPETFMKIKNSYPQNEHFLWDYNVIGYHGARLFPSEYENILKNGLSETNKELFIKKVKLIRNRKYKKYLLNKLSTLETTKSDGKIYLKFGKNEFSKYDVIFLNNWGGETIYNFYDLGGRENKLQREIGEYLRARTTPYIIVCRVKISNALDFIMNAKGLKNEASGCIDVNDIEVLDIFSVTDKDIKGVK